MASGIKLRKIDQLIEKFFYDGLRATNSTPVRVISNVSKHFQSKPSNNFIETYQYRRKIPTKSKESIGFIDDKKDKDFMSAEEDEEESSEPKASTSKEVNLNVVVANIKNNNFKKSG